MGSKKWYQSKTIWANAIAGGAAIASQAFGVDLSGPVSTFILAVLNGGLRLATSKKLVRG